MMSSQPRVVLYDMFELVHGYGKSLGIYLYAIELLREMCESVPDDVRLVVVANSLNASDLEFCASRPGVELDVIPIARMNSRIKLAWEFQGAARAIRRHQAQVYYNMKGFAPGFLRRPGNCRIVLTVHDMIPQWYLDNIRGSGLSARFVAWSIRRSVRWADHIVAISKATQADILALEPDAAGKISVVHDGMTDPVEPILPALTERFIFALSSALPHKNSQVVIDAWNLYRAKSTAPLSLVLCGKMETQPEVISVKGLSYRELAGYYAACDLFVTSSWIEGFGLPPLEAMQQGALVAASDISAHREILVDAAHYFRPDSPRQLADLMLAVEEGRLPHDKQAARSRASSFSWRQAARDIWPLLNQA